MANNQNKKTKETNSIQNESIMGVSAQKLQNMLSKGGDGEKIETMFFDNLQDSYDNIVKSFQDSNVTNSYGNSLLAIGSQDKVAEFTEFNLSNESINWPLWISLYNSSWVFKRAIDKPASDMIKTGIDINLTKTSIDIKKQALKQVKKYRNDLIQLIQWGALFGGSVAIAMFDNLQQTDYEKPIDRKKIKASKSMRFYVVDRWYGVAPSYDETVDEMSDIDFGTPKYYNITLPDGKTYKYHHSYVIRYEHREAPKFIKMGMLQGWGYSEGSHIINELMKDEKLRASVQSLINKSLLEIIKMSGMRAIFLGQSKETEEQLQKRLNMVNWARNYNSLTFLDKEDEYSMNEFHGLAGLSDLLEQNMWQISAALEMQGVLFGDLKHGFSTDNEALERYDDVIQNKCETLLRKPMMKFLKFIYMKLDITEDIDFNFTSLLTNKKDEQRMASISSFSQTLSQLITDGILTPKLAAKSLQQFTSEGVVDFGLTDEEIEKIDDNQFSEMNTGLYEEEDDSNFGIGFSNNNDGGGK